MIRSNSLLSLPTSRQNWLVSVKKVPHCTHLVLSVLCFFRHPVCTLHSAVFPIKTFCTCHKIINIKTKVSSHLWPWKYSTFPGYSMTAANIFEDISSTLLQIKILGTDITTPPYAPRSSRFGSEPPSVEDDVDIWRYAIVCQKRRWRLIKQLT